jgi:hypothetical protein
MLILKIALLPVALLAAALLAMALHIVGTTLHHQRAWTQTTATVLRAETLCEVTYQPADAVLRQVAARVPCDATGDVVLPAGGTGARIQMGLFGTLAYAVDGGTRTWEGKLSDAGVYNVQAGATFLLRYDPADPQNIDTARAKGWFGGLVLICVCAGIVGFYGWLVWPRRRSPPGGGGRTGVAPVRPLPPRRRQSFGKA